VLGCLGDNDHAVDSILLANILPKMVNLEKLSIWFCYITAAISCNLTKLKELKQLTLFSCQFDEYCFGLVLSGLTKLESLNLSVCKLSFKLLSHIAKLEQLQEFIFHSNQAEKFCLPLMKKFRYDGQTLLEGKSEEELKFHWQNSKSLSLRQKQFTCYPDEF
jgi:hypothetical protein